MRKKIVIFSTAAVFSLFGVACGAVQDEVQQQAEDEVNKQKTKAEERLQQEKTKAIEKAKTTVSGG